MNNFHEFVIYGEHRKVYVWHSARCGEMDLIWEYPDQESYISIPMAEVHAAISEHRCPEVTK